MSEPPRPRTSASDRTRAAILDAAAAVLARDPTASLSEVARRAGVGRTTLHRHFADRAALVRALAHTALSEAEVVYDRSGIDDDDAPDETLARLVHGMLELGDRFAFLLREPSIVGDPSVDAAEERLGARVESLIERGRADGTFRTDLPTAWLLEVLVATVYAAWGAVDRGSLERADAHRAVMEVLMGGVAG